MLVRRRSRRAELKVVEGYDRATILEHSAESPMVFLPIRVADGGPELAMDARLADIVSRLQVSLLVLAAEDLKLDAEPDAGKHAEIAEAVDAADRAKEALSQIEKELAKAEDEAASAVRALEPAEEGPEELEKLRKADEVARERVQQARRRVARARAKVEHAIEEAERLTGRPLEKKD